MCGLVGVINKYSYGFTQDQQNVFNTLLFVDMLRGPDSTGVFAVSNTGNVITAKEASNSVDFMKHHEFNELHKRVFRSGSALIGHNRKATRGEIIDENAHPFVVDNNIVLVHNGTMFGDHKKHAEVEVDSHAIAHLIHEKGDVGKALGSFYGAYALIWYDFEQGTLNMIRNSQRPLWFMETHGSWIWSSEREMLEFVQGRFNMQVKEAPQEIPVDTLFTYTLLEKGGWDFTNKAVDIVRDPLPVTDQGSKYDDFDWGDYGTAQWDEAWEKFKRKYPETMRGDDDEELGENPVGSPFRESAPTQQWTYPTQQQQPQTRSVGHNPVREFQPAEPEDLKMRELEIALKSNKKVTYHEYMNSVLPEYVYDTKTVAVAFDYLPVDPAVPNKGYYLYLTPADDQDVIIRIWLPGSLTEEEIIQIAGCEYVYRIQVGVRSWNALMPDENRNPRPDTKGFCVIRGKHPELIAGADARDSMEYH